ERMRCRPDAGHQGSAAVRSRTRRATGRRVASLRARPTRLRAALYRAARRCDGASPARSRAQWALPAVTWICFKLFQTTGVAALVRRATMRLAATVWVENGLLARR